MNHEPPRLSAVRHHFTQLLSSTRRGARLARLLAAGSLHTWDVPPAAIEQAEHLVAELAANAVFHGRVPGRGFRLTLRLDPAAGTLRIEVTDARGDRRPGHRPNAGPECESGRGLLLVTALADRWGTEPHPPSSKTVWCEIGLQPQPTAGCSPDGRSGQTPSDSASPAHREDEGLLFGGRANVSGRSDGPVGEAKRGSPPDESPWNQARTLRSPRQQR
jgi:anti-sigma regulatory factor (Ser/Thr protein kinase)